MIDLPQIRIYSSANQINARINKQGQILVFENNNV